MPFKAVKIKAEDLKPGDCYVRDVDYVEALDFVIRLNSGEKAKVWIWPGCGGFNRYFRRDKTVYKIVWED